MQINTNHWSGAGNAEAMAKLIAGEAQSADAMGAIKHKRGLRIVSLFMALILCLALAACGNSGAKTPVETDAFLQELDGTYEELFPALNAATYDDHWLEKVKAAIGADGAEAFVTALKSSCTGTLYGAEAVAAYTDPQAAQFNSYFINGVDRITVNGNNISGTSKGKEVFSHDYTYQEDNSLGGMMDVRVYKTDDANAGEFTYFLFCPDTPDTTYHIEFRYGSDLTELLEIMTGNYAYWLASGIPVDSNPDFIKACIDLFIEENASAGEQSQ
jgi:hypothetical protein